MYGAKPGDVIRIAEWYGWTGEPNEGVRMGAEQIALGILEREADWGLQGRVRPGPADTSIYDDYEPKRSVAGDMARVGVHWTRADKGTGKPKTGVGADTQIPQRREDRATRQARHVHLGAVRAVVEDGPGVAAQMIKTLTTLTQRAKITPVMKHAIVFAAKRSLFSQERFDGVESS